ncbi:MAG: Asp-tRNA(Asn)/Glu-tRNA(Gln) amidotransferase subunit GatC [Culicoidibacterales bacterium]
MLETKDILKIGDLAKIELDQQDMEKVTAKINEILHLVDTIQELDLDHVEPMIHPNPLQNVFRDDQPQAAAELQPLLANVPEVQDEQIKVPTVLKA